MVNEGTWDEWNSNDARGATLRLGPVFSASVAYPTPASGSLYWAVSLNGEALGGYGAEDCARARAEWEIWNRVRLMRPGYMALLARREFWKSGGGA